MIKVLNISEAATIATHNIGLIARSDKLLGTQEIVGDCPVGAITFEEREAEPKFWLTISELHLSALWMKT